MNFPTNKRTWLVNLLGETRVKELEQEDAASGSKAMGTKDIGLAAPTQQVRLVDAGFTRSFGTPNAWSNFKQAIAASAGPPPPVGLVSDGFMRSMHDRSVKEMTVPERWQRMKSRIVANLPAIPAEIRREVAQGMRAKANGPTMRDELQALMDRMARAEFSDVSASVLELLLVERLPLWLDELMAAWPEAVAAQAQAGKPAPLRA